MALSFIYSQACRTVAGKMIIFAKYLLTAFPTSSFSSPQAGEDNNFQQPYLRFPVAYLASIKKFLRLPFAAEMWWHWFDDVDSWIIDCRGIF